MLYFLHTKYFWISIATFRSYVIGLRIIVIPSIMILLLNLLGITVTASFTTATNDHRDPNTPKTESENQSKNHIQLCSIKESFFVKIDSQPASSSCRPKSLLELRRSDRLKTYSRLQKNKVNYSDAPFPKLESLAVDLGGIVNEEGENRMPAALLETVLSAKDAGVSSVCENEETNIQFAYTNTHKIHMSTALEELDPNKFPVMERCLYGGLSTYDNFMECVNLSDYLISLIEKKTNKENVTAYLRQIHQAKSEQAQSLIMIKMEDFIPSLLSQAQYIGKKDHKVDENIMILLYEIKYLLRDVRTIFQKIFSLKDQIQAIEHETWRLVALELALMCKNDALSQNYGQKRGSDGCVIVQSANLHHVNLNSSESKLILTKECICCLELYKQVSIVHAYKYTIELKKSQKEVLEYMRGYLKACE